MIQLSAAAGWGKWLPSMLVYLNWHEAKVYLVPGKCFVNGRFMELFNRAEWGLYFRNTLCVADMLFLLQYCILIYSYNWIQNSALSCNCTNCDRKKNIILHRLRPFMFNRIHLKLNYPGFCYSFIKRAALSLAFLSVSLCLSVFCRLSQFCKAASMH